VTKPTTTIAPISIEATAASICFPGSEIIMLMALPSECATLFCTIRVAESAYTYSAGCFLAAKHFVSMIPRKSHHIQSGKGLPGLASTVAWRGCDLSA
jgi:hypothetical protein